MNERIELISARCIWVTVNSRPEKIRLVSDGNSHGHWYTESNGGECITAGTFQIKTDAEGRAALIDALQCLRDTGSFAALADTSDVPFTGKRMRYLDSINRQTIHEITICDVESGVALHRDRGSCIACRVPLNDLRPLLPLTPPAPKVTARPWTAREFAGLMFATDRTLEFRDRETAAARFVVSMNHYGVTLRAHEFSSDGYQNQFYEWPRLLAMFEYPDSRPCGIQETPT